MGVLLPQGKHWAASNWIARGFFDDCRRFLHLAPSIGADVQFCIDADLDTLDLESADQENVAELKNLIDAVIEVNQVEQGKAFVDPGQFPLYLEKLTELRSAVDALLQGQQRTESEWKTLVFKYGAEWAPDSPYGLDVLEIDVDGRFLYENRMRGQIRTASGRVEIGTLDAVVGSLQEAGFPAVPSHVIPPGSSLVGIQMRSEGGDEAALMDYFTALKLPGYGEVIRRLAGWASWLRKGETEEPAPPGLIRD